VSEDIIKQFCTELSAFAPLDEVRRVEIQLRQQWGGADVYVQKAPSLPKAERLGAVIAAGLTMREACDAVGVSRSTGYRLVSRFRR
jgi:hypothetical protein